MKCRMMFVEALPGGVLVDVVGDGMTTTFEAQIPFCTWGFAAALTLGRWAVDGAEIDVELQDTRGAHRARMSDGEHLILLDLRSPATVHRCAGDGASAGEDGPVPLGTVGG